MIVDWSDQVSIDSAHLYCRKTNRLVVGITSGCFDIFHYYHLDYLLRCRRLCNILVVGIDSDRLIKDTKGSDRPIVHERQRIEIINALRCVNICFIMDSLVDFERACSFIHQKEYGLIFRNQDWSGRKDIAGTDYGRVIIVPDVEELTSTTEMIKKIQQKGKD
jgi:D-beta-D-heptose 7-phosphate kinase / D-beta-D-heptose 1-phosphate adenosyltransferase